MNLLYCFVGVNITALGQEILLLIPLFQELCHFLVKKYFYCQIDLFVAPKAVLGAHYFSALK